jgi:glucosamine--fructose-6-phosphate aminotransferase (isomerizing)
MAVESVFAKRGRAVHLVDASELLHVAPLEEGSVLIVLSRSGKSVEIVKLMEKARRTGTKVIAVTNTPESPLAAAAAVVLKMEAAFDHLVSVTMYSALTLVGGLLAEESCGGVSAELAKGLDTALAEAGKKMPRWREQIEAASWFDDVALPTYFLGRGGGLASCHETRLLWEEVAKSGASAMTTGGFRHGPQEMVLNGARVALWVDGRILRDADVALAGDLARRGVKVILIGAGISADGVLALDVPTTPEGWQFLVDIMPGQLAAYWFSKLRGMDCDSFSICPYVITSEGGLNAEKT